MNRRTVSKFLLSGFASGALISRNVAAQTPMGSPSSVASIQRLDVDGEAYALSPDGTMIAGYTYPETFCVWDVATSEPSALSEPMPALRILDHRSISWSPDSSAVAWSLDAMPTLSDSDIYVFDVESSTITNLTDSNEANEDAISLLGPATPGVVMNVDMYPAWAPGGADIVFTRSPFGDDDLRETALMRIPRDGGEASIVAQLSDWLPGLLFGPMLVLDDGTVLYGAIPPDPNDPDAGIYAVTGDGEIEGVSTGLLIQDTPFITPISAAPAARKVSAVSLANHAEADPDTPIWFEIDLDTGIPTPFEDVLSLSAEDKDEQILVAAPAFLTDSSGELTGYLYATRGAGDDGFSVWRHDLASAETTLIGMTDDRQGSARRTEHIPQVQVSASGIAALFFMGSAWTIDLG